MSSVRENDPPDYDRANNFRAAFIARPNYPLLPQLLLQRCFFLRSRRLWWFAGIICISSGCQPQATVFEVASSSMAPTLHGPARLANCPHCQNSFPVAADTYLADLPTRCSQCGGYCLVGNEIMPGQRVAITPARDKQTWHRLDLIVFKDANSGATQVKRIWGLPHESIILQNGELFVAKPHDSTPRLFQKTLQQLMQICVPISNYPVNKISGWRISRPDNPMGNPVEVPNAPTQIGISAALLPNESLVWSFHRPAPVHPAEVPAEQWLQFGPIVDDYQVNQGVSCLLHEVSDYLLSVELASSLNGEMTIHCRQGAMVIPITFCSRNSETISPPLPDSLSFDDRATNQLVFHAAHHIRLAWCDNRLLIETDQESQAIEWNTRVLNDSTLPSDDNPTKSPTAAVPLLRIEANCELRLKQIVIARDLFFDDWSGETSGHDGYFVLGDNLPVSIDSRHKLGRIATQQIIGSVENK